MARVSRLGYVGVGSANAAAWKDFGSRILAMNVADDGPDGASRLKIDDAEYRLAIHPGDEDQLLYLGWEVASPSDLEQLCNNLDALGVAYKHADEDVCAERGVQTMVRFEDPLGIPNELYLYGKAQYRSYLPPRATAGFVTGAMGMGHAVLVVPDGPSAEEFYARSLGFRLTDLVLLPPPLGPLRFLRCNQRHHSLGLLQIPGLAGLHHVMFEARELDDVGIAYDLLGGLDAPELTSTLGRHIGDDMVSFYARSPAGFDVEFGWSGTRVEDDDAWQVRVIDVAGGASGEVWGHQYLPKPPPSTVKPI